MGERIVFVDGHSLSLGQVYQVASYGYVAAIDTAAISSMQESRNMLLKKMSHGTAMPGINTSQGKPEPLSKPDILRLQKNLVRSHCCGIGEPLNRSAVRATMILKANALCSGLSGARIEVMEKLIEFLNGNIYPFIPSRGSLGVAGDVVPLAHLALCLMGEGRVFYRHDWHATANVLAHKNITPLELEAKEAQALMSGCQAMAGSGTISLCTLIENSKLLDGAAAMSTEAMQASRRNFDPLAAQYRPHPGHKETCENMLRIMGKSSPLGDSHKHCDKTQDPYCVRCVPSVHGVFKNVITQCIHSLQTEANSCTDSMLVFAERDLVLPCNNFHGSPITQALDSLAMALVNVCSMAERRIAQLLDPQTTGLPAFLAQPNGVDSGLAQIQATAASLVSENQALACATFAGTALTEQADHISPGLQAALKLEKICQNFKCILAIELLCAHQALGFLKPLKPAAGVLALDNFLEDIAPCATKGRVFAEDIQLVTKIIEDNHMLRCLEDTTGPLEAYAPLPL